MPVAFFVATGTTYYVLAIDDQYDGGGNGGLLNISFAEVPPPPTLNITVNPYGKVNTRTGVATISGSYTCTDGYYINLDVEARQIVGRFTILGNGNFFEAFTCNGEPHPWAADIYPQNGKFAGGKTMTVSFAYTCGDFECAFGYAEQKVQLQGGRK